MSTDIFLLSEGKGHVFTPKIKFQNAQIIRFDCECLMECDIFNRNERDYPWELTTHGLNHSFIKERLATSSWYCEAGHPREKSVERQTTIDRLNSTCILKSITLKKPIISGEIETMATDKGRDLRDLILYNGCVVGFSMRSLGKLKKITKANRTGYGVVPPLFITNWDEVVHPSVAKAYMNATISRSVDGSTKSKLNEITGSDKESVVALDESVITEILTESSGVSREVLDWLQVSVSDVNTSFDSKSGLATMKILNEGKTLLVPTNGRVRMDIEDYLSNL